MLQKLTIFRVGLHPTITSSYLLIDSILICCSHFFVSPCSHIIFNYLGPFEATSIFRISYFPNSSQPSSCFQKLIPPDARHWPDRDKKRRVSRERLSNSHARGHGSKTTPRADYLVYAFDCPRRGTRVCFRGTVDHSVSSLRAIRGTRFPKAATLHCRGGKKFRVVVGGMKNEV